MSGGLCPSKSTVYVSNLPFSLTNNDIHKILEKYGRVVKVTCVKDKETHKSTGVAFVLFLEKESASKCVHELNRKELFGRILKCSIAKDNGRASEFIRRKFYKDKTRCYECGEFGHLSYHCPNNTLGDREPVKKEKKKRKFNKGENDDFDEECEDEEEEGEDLGQESWNAAIQYQQEKIEEEEYRHKVATGEYGGSETSSKRKKYKKNEYFSDEEEVDD